MRRFARYLRIVCFLTMLIASYLISISCICVVTIIAIHTSSAKVFASEYLRNNGSTDLYDVEGLLNSFGYPFENHQVVTEDGYILTLHRVPHGRNGSTNTARPPVLVMHGILCCSVNFMFMGPGKSIVPMLADAGYDVWAGNNRGNTWSKKHVSLDPEVDAEFWNFSFQEMGYYDDPAMIDYILNTTGSEKLFYIGHSQGTAQFFAMASSRPEYNNKILLMSALAPVVHCNYLTQLGVRLLAANYKLFDVTTNLLGIKEIGAHSDEITSLCQQESLIEVCAFVLFEFMGYDSSELARERVPQFYQNFPDGTSMKGFKHLVQGTAYGEYSQYNYGATKNLEVYGSTNPPVYNLSLVTSPVALYHSLNDPLSAEKDVDRLSEELPNLARKYLIGYELFSHGDFMYATHLDELVNLEVIEFMKGFSSNEVK